MWKNSHDPSGAHIAIIANHTDAPGCHLAWKNYGSKFDSPLCDGAWHHCEIMVAVNYIFVRVDGVPVIGCWLPYGIDRTYRYIRFTAGTGGACCKIYIDNVKIYVKKKSTFIKLFYEALFHISLPTFR